MGSWLRSMSIASSSCSSTKMEHKRCITQLLITCGILIRVKWCYASLPPGFPIVSSFLQANLLLINLTDRIVVMPPSSLDGSLSACGFGFRTSTLNLDAQRRPFALGFIPQGSPSVAHHVCPGQREMPGRRGVPGGGYRVAVGDSRRCRPLITQAIAKVIILWPPSTLSCPEIEPRSLYRC